MGQKVNPIAARLGINRSFDSHWFHSTNYGELLGKDLHMRRYLKALFRSCGIFFGRCALGIGAKKVEIFPYVSFAHTAKDQQASFRKKTFGTKKNPNLLAKKDGDFRPAQQNDDRIFAKSTRSLLVAPLEQRQSLIAKTEGNKGKLSQTSQLEAASQVSLGLISSRSSGRGVLEKKTALSFVQRFQKESLLTNKSLNFLLPTGSIEYSRSKHHFFIRYSLLLYLVYKRSSKILSKKMLQSELLRFLWKFIDISKPTLSYFSKKGALQQRIIQSKATKDFHSHSVYTPIAVEHVTSSADILCAFIVNKLEEKRKEKRRGFNVLMKQVEKHVKANPGIDGIRVVCSGRIGGAEMAEVKSFKVGRSSLNVFSNHIDYASQAAYTGFGLIGVKVWISFKK